MPPEIARIIQEAVMLGLVATTIVLVAYSPVFRAIGNRILHGRIPPPGTPADSGRVDELSDEMAAVRRQLSETQERLDFAERMLAQQKERGALHPGGER